MERIVPGKPTDNKIRREVYVNSKMGLPVKAPQDLRPAQGWRRCSPNFIARTTTNLNALQPVSQPKEATA